MLPRCWTPSREAADTNFAVSGLAATHDGTPVPPVRKTLCSLPCVLKRIVRHHILRQLSMFHKRCTFSCHSQPNFEGAETWLVDTGKNITVYWLYKVLGKVTDSCVIQTGPNRCLLLFMSQWHCLGGYVRLSKKIIRNANFRWPLNRHANDQSCLSWSHEVDYLT